MKTKINREEEETPIKFPCLMEHPSSGAIVLFTDKKSGVALNSGGSYAKGEVRTDWIMGVFTKFKGEITLSND